MSGNRAGGDPPGAFRLRGSPPRVTRLSRKVLAGLGIVAGLGTGGALIYALQGRDAGRAPTELFSTENRPTADGLQTLPRDYTDVPQLGPPLPGDLGRAIHGARERGQPVPAPGPVPSPAMDAQAQQRLQEMEAARTSQLFFGTETGSAARPAGDTGDAPVGTTLADLGLAPQPATPIAQERQRAFLDAPVDRQTVSSDRLTDPASPYVLQAGSVIPAALITGIRSDLPGQIAAQVTGNVYDSPTGRHLLIPQGARLVGQYESEVAFGQRRVLLVWTRLIMPDGRSIVLERQPGADAEGQAGLEDGVDYHWDRVFLAAGLSTILNVGAELGTSSEDRIADAIRDGLLGTVGRTGEEIVSRQLDVQPTLTIRPGFPVRVLTTRDLVLEPYGA